jgi:hypothetical protein
MSYMSECLARGQEGGRPEEVNLMVGVFVSELKIAAAPYSVSTGVLIQKTQQYMDKYEVKLQTTTTTCTET